MEQKNWKQAWKPGVAAVLLVLAGLFYGFFGRSDGIVRLEENKQEMETPVSVLETVVQPAETMTDGNMGTAGVVEAQIYYVHVCGEVNNPGVYALPEGSRIFEAVEAAGGLTDLAEERSLNQAKLIEDGMQIAVPNREEAAAQENIQKEIAQGLVNLNAATKEQLMTLPGIGESRAEAILQYREQSGGFQAVEEIMNVSGIKEAAFEKIRDKITI